MPLRRALLLLLFASGAHAADPALFPIQQNGRVGFIDRTGTVVIEPQYDETLPLDARCPPFHEGLQPVRIDNAWGFIDARGTLVIPARFQSASCFSEGVAGVRLRDEPAQPPNFLYGYIDRGGKWAIPPRFDEAHPFAEGLAMVELDHAWGYIDHRARIVIPITLRARSDCSTFSGGLACFMQDGRWGFMDKLGKTVIAPQFESVTRFADGLSAARRPGSFQPFGYIDRTGAFVIPEQFFLAWEFADGRGGVQLDNGRTAFVDKTGKPVATLDRNVSADPFSDGLAKVKFTDAQRAETIGYVDKNGKIAIPPRFVEGTPFVNGLARVDECGTSGYIDAKGNPVWGLAKRARPDTPAPAASNVHADAIAHASGHPGPLNVVQAPATTACTQFGKAVWSLHVAAADGSFAGAQVVLLEGGTFLNAEKQAMLDQVLAQVPKGGAGEAMARRVAGHPGGFTSVLALGPGGALLASAIPSPDGAFDLLVLTSVAGEGGGLKATEAAKVYQQRLSKDPIGVTEAMALAAWDGLFAER